MNFKKIKLLLLVVFICTINFELNGESTSNGAAIYMNNLDEMAQSIFENVQFINNVSDGNTGGVRLYASSPIFKNVLIAGNTDQGSGGGLRLLDASHPILINTTIVNNTSI